jgi:hypothetical protein
MWPGWRMEEREMNRQSYRALALLLLAAAALLVAGCVTVPGERQAPTSVDVAETGPGSLKVDVTDYSWSYLTGNTHIRVSGNVVNNSGVPIQGVSLYATLHDQNGAPIAFGESYVAPTYLNPGATGTFEFTALAKRERGLKATRLVTIARPLAGY